MVPHDFWLAPEEFGEDMHAMVRAHIVEQQPIRPNIEKLACFEKNFIRFLDDNPVKRRTPKEAWVNVHVEKLGHGELGEYLVKKGLANPPRGSWMLTEYRTARDFMAYLATCVANRNERRFIAATDNR